MPTGIRLLQLQDYLQAFFNRLLIVRCPNQFQGKDRDPTIVEDLSSEQARSHCLNRAIEGANRLLEKRRFTRPDRVEEQVRQYQLRTNSVAAFIEECTTDDPEGAEPKKKMYRAYKAWCEEYGMTPKKYQSFCRDAQKAPHYLKTGRKGSTGNQTRCFQEVALSVDEATQNAIVNDGNRWKTIHPN